MKACLNSHLKKRYTKNKLVCPAELLLHIFSWQPYCNHHPYKTLFHLQLTYINVPYTKILSCNFFLKKKYFFKIWKSYNFFDNVRRGSYYPQKYLKTMRDIFMFNEVYFHFFSELFTIFLLLQTHYYFFIIKFTLATKIFDKTCFLD